MFYMKLLVFSILLISSNISQAQNRSLGHAASNGNYYRVLQTIEKGADVNSMEYKGWTPLTISIRFKHVGIAKYLIDNGADVNLESDAKWTPLTIASRYGLEDLVNYLIENGAQIDQEDGFGHSAMYYAVKVRDHEIISILEKNKQINIEFSLFTTDELKDMYKDAIFKKEDLIIKLIEEEMDIRSKNSD